jgi:hypothetical protein
LDRSNAALFDELQKVKKGGCDGESCNFKVQLLELQGSVAKQPAPQVQDLLSWDSPRKADSPLTPRNTAAPSAIVPISIRQKFFCSSWLILSREPEFIVEELLDDSLVSNHRLQELQVSIEIVCADPPRPSGKKLYDLFKMFRWKIHD